MQSRKACLASQLLWFIAYSASVSALPEADEGGMALSQVSQFLISGGDILTKVMWAACIVVGIALIAAAFTQFQIHRRNPKLVPLTTPIMYLILGIVAIAIPFVTQVKTFSGSSKPGAHTSAASAHGKPQPAYDPNDIDAPLQ